MASRVGPWLIQKHVLSRHDAEAPLQKEGLGMKYLNKIWI
jgi:hypothetical protein